MCFMGRGIVLAGLAVALTGCGDSPATRRATALPVDRVALEGAGLSISVPPHWHLARRLTALTEPTERFTIASYPVAAEPRKDRACGPTQAVAHIPRDGALAFVFEYRARGRRVPPRPKRFALPTTPAAAFECFGRGWFLRFGEHGRAFQVMIAAGSRSSRNRSALLAALDTLRVDPTRGEG